MQSQEKRITKVCRNSKSRKNYIFKKDWPQQEEQVQEDFSYFTWLFELFLNPFSYYWNQICLHLQAEHVQSRMGRHRDSGRVSHPPQPNPTCHNCGICSTKTFGNKQKRSTEGCSKFKSPETRQVQERLVSTLEHMQVPKWDRTRCPEESASPVGMPHPLHIFCWNLSKSVR